MPRTLARVEIWDDVEANGGTIQTIITDWSTAEESFELETGKEQFLLEMARNSDAWSDVQHRAVLRPVLSDGSYDEWRIADVDDSLSDRGGERAILPAESIRYDLGSRIIERVENDGRAHGVFTLLSMTPEEHIDFLLGFAPSAIAPMLSIGTYLSFAAALLFASGFVFELPLVLLALAWIGVLSSQMLARFRRAAIVAALAIGAIITPSADIFSQALLAGALVALYELSIWLIRATGR